MVHFPTQKGKKHVPKHTHFGACNKAICKTYKPPVQDLHHSVQCGTTHTLNITFCSGKLCSILISWLNAIKQVSFIDGFRNAGSFRFSHSKCLFPQLEKATWHGPTCCIHPRTRSRRCQCYLRFKTRPRNTHVDPRDTLHRRRRESLSDRVCEWEEGRGGGEGRRGRAPRVLLAQPPPQHWASPLPTHLSYYTKLPCCHHISAIVPAHCYRSVTISPLHLLLHLLLVLGDCFPTYFPRLTSLHHTLTLSLAFAVLIPHSPHIMGQIITILQRCQRDIL